MIAQVPLPFRRLAGIGFACMSLLVAACGGSSATGTATATGVAVTPTLAVTPGPQPCPSPATAAFYGGLIGLTPDQTVGKVICADFKGNGQLEALVGVFIDGTGHYMDWYVYSMPSGATATQLFYRKDIAGGDIAVSEKNTVLVMGIDLQDCVNIDAPATAALRQSWGEEFGWNGTTFLPVVYPGFFPHMSRYTAEYDQGQVDSGAVTAQTPVQVVNDFFTTELGYAAADPATAIATSDDANATVTSNGFTLNLKRLVKTGTNGVWDIVGLAPQTNLTLTAPVSLTLVASPITIAGTGAAFEGQIGASVRDHANCEIGNHTISGLGVGTPAAFSGTVSYTADAGVPIHTGEGSLEGTAFQEATVWVAEQSAKGDGTYVTLQIFKLLIG